MAACWWIACMIINCLLGVTVSWRWWRIFHLSALATSGPCNDMVIDAQGRAYVGNFGFDLHAKEEARATCLLRIDLDGSVHRVAEDVWFPNGMAITHDGQTLIVAQTFRNRLATRSPTAMPLTPSPKATTRQASSCPRITGGGRGMMPLRWRDRCGRHHRLPSSPWLYLVGVDRPRCLRRPQVPQMRGQCRLWLSVS